MQDTKEQFVVWLNENKHKSSLSSCVDCLEKSSNYAIEKNMSKESFWQIKDVRRFNAIRSKLLSNKIFKFFSKSNFKMFIIAGKLYSEFLKSAFASKERETNNKSHESELMDHTESTGQEMLLEQNINDGIYRVADLEDALTAFKKWFIDKGRANSTARSYVNSVTSMINHFQNEWTKSSVDNNLANCIKLFIDLLSVNKKFIESNERMHNQFTASLNAFLQFLTDINKPKKLEQQSVNVKQLKKRTIAEAIVLVLKQRQPLTIREIYDEINRCKLYEFGAKNPLVAVRTTLLRQCINNHSDERALKTKLFFQSRNSNDNAIFSLIDGQEVAANDPLDDAKGVLLLNWENDADYTRTKPIEIEIFNRKLYLKSWTDALVKICTELHAKYPSANFLEFTRPNLRRVFSQTGKEFISPKQVVPMLFVETNFESNRIIAMIKEISNYLSFDVNDIRVHYKKIERKEFNKPSQDIKATKSDFADMEGLLLILNKNFQNGYTLGFISAEKLKRYYKDLYHNEIQLSNDEINILIEKNAFTYDGKKYYSQESVVSSELLSKIAKHIDEQFRKGAKYISYSNLYEELSMSYAMGKVFNADCLKKILKFSFVTKYKFKTNNFYPLGSKLSVKTEQRKAIKDVLIANTAPVNLDELSELIPQIPKSAIKFILNSEDEFTYTEPNFYTHVSCIKLQNADLENAKSIIDESINRKGYIAKSELLKCLEQHQNSLFTNNFLFSEHAIYNALSYHFRNEYSRQGIIISSIKNPKDSSSILIDFLGSRDEVVVSEIKEEAENIGKQLSSTRLNEVSINFYRVSQDKLINKKLIHFDVAATDAVIAEFCEGDFVSIVSIDFFSLFPRVISQKVVTWNSFLLEEYVRSESKEFKYITNSSSLDKTIGAIVRKTSRIENYDEVLSAILGRIDDVDLEEKTDVLEYLFEQNLIASRKLSNIDIIVHNALKLKEAR